MARAQPINRKQAVQRILSLIQPGDVINVDSRPRCWQLFHRLAYWSIRRHQKVLFGRSSRFRDTHCMLYFEPDKILSVEPPKAKWTTLEEYCQERITIWRYTKRQLVASDVVCMVQAAQPLIGTLYDVGQLLDLAVNHILGYPQVIRYPVFDFSSRLKVCSVGVRMAFEHLRKQLPAGQMPRLFSSFKVAAWARAGKAKKLNTFGKGVDVEATAPAHFANSGFFDDEFELVAELDRGRRIS